MSTLVTVIHVITCSFLILLILLQSGKGAEISASLGGSSQTIFGSSGGANFFTRATSVLASVFMVTSITLTLLSGHSKKSVFEGQVVPVENTTTVAIPAESAAPVVQESPNTTPSSAQTE